MSTYKIALIGGDGIGPEVSGWARKAVDKAAARGGSRFEWVELSAGGRAIDETGEPLPAATLEAARAADAVLLGAVGGPRWETLPGHLRPERALLGLRAGLGVYANLRPAALLPELRDACPLKDEIVRAGPGGTFDLLIVRELTGGIYFGKRGRDSGAAPADDSAYDTETYSRREIERILRVSFEAARGRRKKLCLVDKANVLESSRFWREVAQAVAPGYPDVTLDYLYVDNAAMQLVRAPGQFDVIVTSNLFGDILSDEASVISGSIGMLASASIGDPPAGKTYPAGLYEPIHGSAPDIAGKDLANPLGAILSGAMMLRHSFGLETEARRIESAVSAVLKSGLRTPDIACRGVPAPGERITGTAAMGEAVLREIEKH